MNVSRGFIVVTKISPGTWKIVDFCMKKPVIPFSCGEELKESVVNSMGVMFGYTVFKVDKKIAKIARTVYLKRKRN